jgi:hypothetical protein
MLSYGERLQAAGEEPSLVEKERLPEPVFETLNDDPVYRKLAEVRWLGNLLDDELRRIHDVPETVSHSVFAPTTHERSLPSALLDARSYTLRPAGDLVDGILTLYRTPGTRVQGDDVGRGSCDQDCRTIPRRGRSVTDSPTT